MERRVTRKVETHMVGFKNAIKIWLEESGNRVSTQPLVFGCIEDKTSEFLKYVFDYEGVELTKEDFQKRKRVKNVVPHCDRCIAKRANTEQCTRRKSGMNPYCGTHAKGTPHGIMSGESDEMKSQVKIEVWVEEIKGINYYIDNCNNVYKHEDVLNNKSSPDIIAKWEHTDGGGYCIPEYGI